MVWNYRIIMQEFGDEAWYGLHECYYPNGKDKTNSLPNSWAIGCAEVGASSKEELREMLQNMLADLDQPVLMENGNKLVEAGK